MDCIKAIEERRSVRKYKDEKVPLELVKKIIGAGSLAPTGGNMQPWEFIVIENKENIEKIVATTFIGFNRYSSQRQLWINKAPVLIVVCADFIRTVARYGEIGKEIALMDVSAAIQNMLLCTTALGLGSCWVSGYDKEALSKVLSLPDNIEPIGILPIGYPEVIPGKPNKFSLEEIIHYEEYGNIDF